MKSQYLSCLSCLYLSGFFPGLCHGGGYDHTQKNFLFGPLVYNILVAERSQQEDHLPRLRQGNAALKHNFVKTLLP